MAITERDLIKLFRTGTTAELNDTITQLTEQVGQRESERIYTRALKAYDRETEQADGPIHTHFSLSYASYEVVPRVLAQSMPHEWQARFVACLDELHEAFAHIDSPDCYDVKPAQDVYANELDEAQQALTGVTSEWDEDQDREVYHDRDGNEIEGWTHIMVPAPDPLPPYSRAGAARGPDPEGELTVSSTRRPWLKLKVKSPFWREVLAEAGAQPAAAEVSADDTAYPGQPGSRWRDIDGDVWMHGDDGGMWLISLRSEPRSPAGLNNCYGPMTRMEGGGA